MFGIGQNELIIIAVVLLLLFGPTAIPALGRNLGETIAAFRRSVKDIQSVDEDDVPPKKEK